MLQLEMEKAGLQLVGISKMKEILAKIDLSKKSKIAHLGSIVKTTSVNYFLSISVGKLTVFGKDYISISSSIGKLLLGKQEKGVFTFQNKQITIVEIS
jgi:hypothetical protein